LATLKPQAFVEDAIDHKNGGLFDDSTVQTMEKYFHIQDRDVLLKYLRDTLLPASDK